MRLGCEKEIGDRSRKRKILFGICKRSRRFLAAVTVISLLCCLLRLAALALLCMVFDWKCTSSPSGCFIGSPHGISLAHTPLHQPSYQIRTPPSSGIKELVVYIADSAAFPPPSPLCEHREPIASIASSCAAFSSHLRLFLDLVVHTINTHTYRYTGEKETQIDTQTRIHL